MSQERPEVNEIHGNKVFFAGSLPCHDVPLFGRGDDKMSIVDLGLCKLHVPFQIIVRNKWTG